VLVDAELLPVLADLDHAVDAHGAHLPADDEVVGHPAHVDHRQFAGDPPGPRTDLHALGTTVWTVLTGSPPPRDRPQDPVVLPHHPRVPASLHALLAACLDASIGDAAAAASALQASAIELLSWTAPAQPAATSATPTALPADVGAMPSFVPRVSALAGGGAGGSDAMTRRWGPRPERTVAPAAATVRRTGWLAAAAAVLLLPALGLTLWATRDDTLQAAAATAAGVVAPPLCEPEVADEGVAADLDGDGCSELLQLTAGVLVTPAGSFRLGQPDDVLVAGDWDGDGRWSPGLYRPTTGEVFLFDAAPGDEALSSRPAQQQAARGVPTVVHADRNGSHEVVVVGAAT